MQRRGTYSKCAFLCGAVDCVLFLNPSFNTPEVTLGERYGLLSTEVIFIHCVCQRLYMVVNYPPPPGE